MSKLLVVAGPFLGLVMMLGCDGCSDILVTPDASDDGSAMIAYNSDSGRLFGSLYHYPPTTNNTKDDMRQVFDWDSGRYLGEIPEAEETYNVVGNTNEWGLCIGESTAGGVAALAHQEGAIVDYGSLIYITLQRAKTALEAIDTMVTLMDDYGYASEGESFSIADRSGEVWIMEVIGRGTDYGRLGAVWVARRVPEGYITAHANQHRITTFPRDDPDNCMFADDVVDVAVHYSLYPADADPNDFSFSDVYCPVTFETARLAEARVWSIFSAFADDRGAFQQEYLDYASGKDITHRMPLWIKPYKKVSAKDVIDALGNHAESTDLDASADVGGGVYHSPYRPRPLVWSLEGKSHHNERTVGTQQTGWSMVAQVRPWLPREIAALTWFAVDDSSTSPRVPAWGGIALIGRAYAGKGAQDGEMEPILDFDMSKAFWIQNMVANFAYPRWDAVFPLIRAEVDKLYLDHKAATDLMEKTATEIYDEDDGPARVIAMATDFHVAASETLQMRWQAFYGELFARFRDFFDIVSDPDDPGCGCKVQETGMADDWKKRIVNDRGDHYAVPTNDNKEQHQPSSSLRESVTF